jgi:hypothetical protein
MTGMLEGLRKEAKKRHNERNSSRRVNTPFEGSQNAAFRGLNGLD